jgi:tyrosyl-tRNA synthetase
VWRYYELLTDVTLPEIEEIKAQGNPLDAKKQLARRIVSDFHSAEEAERIASAWGGLPPLESLEHYAATDARMNRVLVQAKFVSSNTEADKIIKANGVAVYAVLSGDESAVSSPSQKLSPGEYIVRVGKKYKHVSVNASE